MRKLGITLLIILLLIFGGLYFIAFTQSGNDILKPYIEKAVSEKIQKDVKIDKFTLTTDHLTIKAKVPNEADLIVDGAIKIFSQWFDLSYYLTAKNLKTPTMVIKQKLQVTGKAKGVVDDFNADGKGLAFGSSIDFNVHIKNKMPLDGVIDAKGLNIAELLEFAGKPAYVKGRVDIVANVKNKNNNLSGDANILVHESLMNSKFIKRDFKIDLPKNTTFVAKIDGVVKDNLLHLTNNIVSSLASLKTTKTNVDLKSFDVSSDFLFEAQNLNRLTFLTQKKLYGALKVNGDVAKKGKDITLNANSKIFDGIVKVNYTNDNAKLQANSLKIKKILAMLGENAMAYGILNVNANIKNASKDKRSGDLNVMVKNGELVGTHLRQLSKINFPPVTNFALNSNIKIAGQNIEAKSKLLSSIANLVANKTLFNTKTSDFSSDFSFSSKNLAHLGKMFEQELRGSFSANGDVSMKSKKLALNLNSQSLGGDLDIKLENDNLEAKLQNVLMQKIVFMLNKPHFIKGNLQAKANFTNISSKAINGDFDLKLQDGFLLGKGLRKLAANETKYPNQIPIALTSKIDVKNSFASFSNNINSSLVSMPQFNGTYDINSKKLDSKYKMDIADLSTLAFLTGQVLHGKLNATGIVQMQNDKLKATVNAPIIGGQSKSIFNDGILTSKANGISIIGLSELLGLPKVFNSRGDFNFFYDTKSKKGKYDLVMQKGQMISNQLTNMVKTFTRFDMTKEVYKNTTLKGVINNDKATYKLDMKGNSTALLIPNGVYNITTKRTNANFKFRLQKTDISGDISGNANSPKIKITSSNYLQNKAKKVADKAIDKYVPKEQKKLVKDILNLF